MHKKGLYIAVEGLDGTGKSTSMRILANKLRAHHKPFLITKEPFIKTPESKRGWAKIEHGDMSRSGQIRFFAKNGKWHRDHIVNPALKQGKIVITSRALASSLAYQGNYKNVDGHIKDTNHVMAINQKIGDVKHNMPDENVYFKMTPQKEIGRIIGRANGKTHKVDQFDRKMAHVSKIKSMQKNYKYALDQMPQSKLVKVNGDKGSKRCADVMFNSIQHLQAQQIHQNVNRSEHTLSKSMPKALFHYDFKSMNESHKPANNVQSSIINKLKRNSQKPSKHKFAIAKARHNSVHFR